jgi:quinol monooxygenase YgiN
MTYVVSVTWTAKAGEEDAVAGALERMREQSADEAAYTAHTETEPFQRDGFGDAIPRLADRRREFYETMD